MEQIPDKEESTGKKDSEIQQSCSAKAEEIKPSNSNPNELSDLLDSCLEDFAPKKPVVNSKPKKSPSPQTSFGAKATSSGLGIPDASTWSDEFKQFNKMMENYLDDAGEITDMKKWMESLSGGAGIDPPVVDEDFAKTFADTLRELTEQAQNIPEASPEDLATLLGGLDLGDAAGADSEQLSDVMPLMQNVMQKLMSKELLYPSIKEITEKYPDWLRERQSTLSTQEYGTYKKQYDLMVKVCEEFEAETDNSDSSSKQQFEKILLLMQQIQNYGNPPKELVSNIGPGVPLDEMGNLQIPGLPQQCSIM